MEGTSCFDPDPVDIQCPALTPSCFDPSYTPPFFEYDNTGFGSDACSVTGGYVYRGGANPGLQGAYVFGDFCGGLVWTLDETSPGVWTRSELFNLGFGLTSFGEDASGELYITRGDSFFRVLPEPSSLLALSAGLALLTQLQRRRRNRLRRSWQFRPRGRPVIIRQKPHTRSWSRDLHPLASTNLGVPRFSRALAPKKNGLHFWQCPITEIRIRSIRIGVLASLARPQFAAESARET